MDNDKKHIPDINDICEYLEIPVCCHPEYNAGEVSEEFCLKCEHRKIPIKMKAISLLSQMIISSSNVGYMLDSLLSVISGKPKEVIQKELIDLSNTIVEATSFLNSIGVSVEEGVIKENADVTRTKKSMGRRSTGSDRSTSIS